jgi:peptide/nickel transport system substrate-binding protein
MTRWLTDKKLRRVAASSLMVAGLCGGMLAGIFASASTASAAKAKAGPKGILYMESSPEPTLTDTFNPYGAPSSQVTVGATSLIYESMLQFDIAAPTNPPYDFLATSYSWANGGKTIQFIIRKNVEFSNGTVLTPAMVAADYEAMVTYPGLNAGGLAVTSAEAHGNAVSVHFSAPQYTNLLNVATLPIVGPDYWAAAGKNPVLFPDRNPVGTGPYMLVKGYTGGNIALVYNTKYWGGPTWSTAAPYATNVASTKFLGPKEVYFPQLASNTNVIASLDNNSLDWAGNFLTGLSSTFLSSAGVAQGHSVWFAPVNTVTIWPNLSTGQITAYTAQGLDVREAISDAVDRAALSSLGESGFEPPATNESGLTEPGFSSLIDTAIGSFSSASNASAADAAMAAAGYTVDSNGFYSTNGTTAGEINIHITDPTAYTDYAADAAIVVQDLKAAKINATFDGTDPTTWGTNMADGSFTLGIHWGASSISAYQVYNNWLNTTLQGTGGGDFERLPATAVDSSGTNIQTDLATLAAATTTAAQITALKPLEDFVAAELPVIPILYGASFDEYNAKAFTGWPHKSFPYESGSPNTPTNEVIVLHLRAG